MSRRAVDLIAIAMSCNTRDKISSYWANAILHHYRFLVWSEKIKHWSISPTLLIQHFTIIENVNLCYIFRKLVKNTLNRGNESPVEMFLKVQRTNQRGWPQTPKEMCINATNVSILMTLPLNLFKSFFQCWYIQLVWNFDYYI